MNMTTPHAVMLKRTAKSLARWGGKRESEFRKILRTYHERAEARRRMAPAIHIDLSCLNAVQRRRLELA